MPISVIEFIVCVKVLPHVHSGLAKFCSHVGTWMQQEAAEGPYEYSDYSSFSKVICSAFLKLKPLAILIW